MSTCIYRYDPLDRLAHTAQDQGARRYFYQAQRRVSEMAADRQLSLLHTGQQGLAVHEQSAAGTNSTLIAPDQQDSVLVGLSSRQRLDLSYCPYGHQGKASALPGFNGEFPEGPTGHYLLGNGYRAFNPVLMRFNSPDSLSPFGAGGLNAYAYCAGDPLNLSDGSGHMFRPVVPLPGARNRSNVSNSVPAVKQQPAQTAAASRPDSLSRPLMKDWKEPEFAKAKADVLKHFSGSFSTLELPKRIKLYEKHVEYQQLEVMKFEKIDVYDVPELFHTFSEELDRYVFNELIEHAKKYVAGRSPMNDIRARGRQQDRTFKEFYKYPRAMRSDFINSKAFARFGW